MAGELHEIQAFSPDAYFDRQQMVAAHKRLEEKVAFLENYNRHLVESSGACILLVNEDGLVQSLNRRARESLEVLPQASCLNVHWTSLFRELDAKAVPVILNARMNSTFLASSKTRLGDTKYWSFTFSGIGGSGGKRDRFLVVAREITEHIQVEKALRQSEEAFRKIFEENSIGILLANLDFRVIKVNNALCGMLGFAEKDVVGRTLQEITLGQLESGGREDIERLLQGEIRSFASETMIETCRKEKIWVHLITSIIRDEENQPRSVLQMIENIHARKESEAQVLAYQQRLQTLASEVSLSEERERRKIATHLHDRIGQSLAFAKLKLATLKQKRADGSIDEILELIEETIADTRSLTFELSPPVLYELGLVPALEWLSRKIQEDHNIATRFHDDGQPKPLDEDFRVVVFQAVRELLLNVVKHARASHAQVLLRRDADALRVIIEDDGIGFDLSKLSAEREAARSFGLFNVQERVEYLGGRLKLRSEPGRGTRITLIAPLKPST
jgi:PAS domain S-box-containing protein